MAALEIGDAARTEADPDVLRSLESELARLPFESDVLRAYALALTDMISALVRRLEGELVDERSSQLAIRRAEYLEVLREGSRTPSQIATAVSKDLGQVSRELEGLRQAGLVELFAVDDKRERPHRLTLRGRRALPEAPPTKREWEIEHSVPEASAAVFRRTLFIHATVRVDVTIAELFTDLWRESEAPRFLLDLKMRAPPDETSIVIRSNATHAWQQLFFASSFMKRRWRECSLMPDAMANDHFAQVPDERYVVIYDDPRQEQLDRANAFGRKLLGNADGRFLVKPVGAERTLALEALP